MILPFKANSHGKPTGFKYKILNFIKIHTFRQSIERYKVGETLHCCYYARNPKMHVFAELICKSVEHVSIHAAKNSKRLSITVSANGKTQLLTHEVVEEIAKNDGFESVEQMRDWFFPCETPELIQSWHGVIVHWTDKRYFKREDEVEYFMERLKYPTHYTYFLEDVQQQHPSNVLPMFKFNGKDMKLLFIKEDVVLINSDTDLSPLIAKIDVGLKRMEGREVTKGKVLFNVKPGQTPNVQFIKSI